MNDQELYDGDDTLHNDEDEDDSACIPCDECGAEIYEDAVQCPRCGWYVTVTSAGGRSPRWERLVRIGLLMLGLGTVAYLSLWLAG